MDMVRSLRNGLHDDGIEIFGVGVTEDIGIVLVQFVKILADNLLDNRCGQREHD